MTVPTALDNKLVPKALALINKFGLDATFVNITVGPTFVPGSGTVTKTTANVVRKVSPPAEKRRYGEAGVIRKEATVIYVAASGLTFTPTKGNRVTVGTITYTIEEANPYYSGEQIAVWELVLAS